VETLTRKEYWDEVHEAEEAACLPRREPIGAPPRPTSLAKRALKRLMGRRLLEAMRSYDDYLLWSGLYPRFLPPAGSTVVEVGSAPGEHLVRLKQTFGLVPYGIEYSDTGVALNRELFAAHGIDPRNVIHSDFFAPELRAGYRAAFDVVLSRGFIEHFDDPRPVVNLHLDLLREGGLLIVSIPNLRGLNRPLTGLFHREVLAIHNLAIMTRPAFATLFDPRRVEALHCDYYGTFTFGLYNARRGTWQRRALGLCQRLQLPLNAAFRLLFGTRGAESRLLSPSLIFIGRKRAEARRTA
jgi:SAM-dependent methyltransferase